MYQNDIQNHCKISSINIFSPSVHILDKSTQTVQAEEEKSRFAPSFERKYISFQVFPTGRLESYLGSNTREFLPHWIPRLCKFKILGATGNYWNRLYTLCCRLCILGDTNYSQGSCGTIEHDYSV